jgi:hypothetical protein
VPQSLQSERSRLQPSWYIKQPNTPRSCLLFWLNSLALKGGINEALVVLTFSAITSYAAAAELEQYQKEIEWSANDGGVVECAGAFISHGVGDCLPGGIDAISFLQQGRACVMTKAIEIAKRGQCPLAFELTKLTQCHNGASQNIIAAAGIANVCAFLKRF